MGLEDAELGSRNGENMIFLGGGGGGKKANVLLCTR